MGVPLKTVLQKNLYEKWYNLRNLRFAIIKSRWYELPQRQINDNDTSK